MPFNDPQSPVLIEQASPLPSPHSLQPSSPQIPAVSNLLNELVSAESSVSVNVAVEPQQQETITMERPAEPPEPAAVVPNNLTEPQHTAPSIDDTERTPNSENVEALGTLAEPAVEPVIETEAEHAPSAATTTETIVGTLETAVETEDTEDVTEVPSATLPSEPVQDSENEENATDTADTIPSWAKYEEDLSLPDEEEMKEIEGSEYDKLSALDISAMEEQFYTDVEDPEQRPVKKLRLSWLIKGVRGTPERPNFARVMNSPGAYVDGLYWSIKFYPRGDNCSSLSAFVRCSRQPPPVDEECPESEFSFWEGAPDATFSRDAEPQGSTTIFAKTRPKTESRNGKEDESECEEMKKPQTDVTESEATSTSTATTHQETNEASGDKAETQDLPNWRVSAQLGMAIYNPAEARTGHLQSDGHQFSRHCDDWGWVNFVGPWDEIHKRKRGQRQALLRNDTLAIDAYVRIYDDPTEALWWHESKDESQWPSKELAGYFPVGTPGLYHSPAVAGITAWMLLAPFREILQSIDGGRWRVDSKLNPKPLICGSQLVLDQMRNLSTDCYINLYKIIEEFLEVDEVWNDVKSFWEVFRRGLELELTDEPEAMKKLASIFDTTGSRWQTPSLPVTGSTTIQQGLANYLDNLKFRGGLPNFMPVVLNRSEFDSKRREWNLHNDRVRLNDQLDLSKWCTDADTTYTLYGFMVHVGARNSGKFYSVLRPGGTGTKWLAFEDGNGNKVLSYSKKRVQEFEGLEGEELRTFPLGDTRENAYMAIYIRTSCIESYLPGKLEPYKVNKWLVPWADDPREDDESQVYRKLGEPSTTEADTKVEDNVRIELYLDECAEGCENMLKLHDLRTAPVAREMCRTITVATDKTFKYLRRAIARAFEVDEYTKIQLWEIHYQGLGRFSRATLEPVSHRRKISREVQPGQAFRLWVSVQQPVGDAVSYKPLLDRLNHLEFFEKESEDENSVELVNAESVETTVDIVAEQQITPIAESAPSIEETSMSAADVEQTAVQAAVQADVENAGSDQHGPTGHPDVTVAAASTDPSESSEGEEGMLTPTSSARSVVAAAEPVTTQSEIETQAEMQTALVDDGSVPPFVHGHLTDAAQHADIGFTLTTATIPYGDADALAQVLTEVPANGEVIQVNDGTEGGLEGTPQTEQEHGMQVPTQVHVPRTYGYIQVFDADNQKFIAQRPFHPEHEMEVGQAVKQQLKYDDSRSFKIWRRHGPTGTESVQASTTFSSAGLIEVFTLIVGDDLSESKIDELKEAGKFWQPHQLISYLGMLKRKHPYAALTSSEPVELADFGNDYYKGPLSRGRPHGAKCHLITSTGHTYIGPFAAGQKCGPQGLMTYQNGDTYVGEWFNDERHGQGEYVEKRTGNRYVGGFENGKRWGQGVTYWQVADQQADMCQICYEEEIDALFYDCGHVCACVTCAKQCETCPICRKSIRHVVRMYRA